MNSFDQFLKKVFFPFVFLCLIFGALSVARLYRVKDFLPEKERTDLASFQAKEIPSVSLNELKVGILPSSERTDFSEIALVFGAVAGLPKVKPYLISNEKSPVLTQIGLAILPHFKLEDAPLPDVIIFPSELGTPSLKTLTQAERFAKTAKAVLCLGSGVEVCARLSILDQKKAVLAPHRFTTVSRRFPKTQFTTEGALIQDKSVFTSIGKLSTPDAVKAVLTFLSVADASKINLPSPELITQTGAALPWSPNWIFKKSPLFAISASTGVSELSLAYLIEPLSQSLRVRIALLTPNQGPIETASHLTLLPTVSEVQSLAPTLLLITSRDAPRPKTEYTKDFSHLEPKEVLRITEKLSKETGLISRLPDILSSL